MTDISFWASILRAPFHGKWECLLQQWPDSSHTFYAPNVYVGRITPLFHSSTFRGSRSYTYDHPEDLMNQPLSFSTSDLTLVSSLLKNK